MKLHVWGGLVLGLALPLASPAMADKIKHPVAVFAGLDKITGRIISFEVKIGETVQFGSLHVTPRVCYTRPPTEAPHTTGFVEVEEVEKDDKFKKIFTGWMFAASPGLSAAEHPVYDVWLTDCKGDGDTIRDARVVDEPPADAGPALTGKPETPDAPATPQRRARPKRNAAQTPPGTNPSAQGRPRPPASVPQQRAQQPRRAPSQSFFPTFQRAPEKPAPTTFY